MKKIFIYLSIGLSIINGSSIVTFSSYELSLDTLNGNYIRINKFDKLDSLNISISYDSNSIELGLPMTESSNNDLTDFSFKEGSLIIKSNPEYNKLNLQDEDHSILIWKHLILLMKWSLLLLIHSQFLKALPSLLKPAFH